LVIRERIRCLDLPTKHKLSIGKRESSKHKRQLAKERKKREITERLLESNDGLGELCPDLVDQVEEWVYDYEECLESNEDDERAFFDSITSPDNMAIEATGTRWYHDRKPLGRFFKSIREGCNEHNRTTIIVVRGGDEAIYRLGVPKGQETGILSKAISQGYILSRIKISGQDRE
jgi:hypothetical protein